MQIWMVTISDYLLIVIDFALIFTGVLAWAIYEYKKGHIVHHHGIVYSVICMFSLLGFIWGIRMNNTEDCET